MRTKALSTGVVGMLVALAGLLGAAGSNAHHSFSMFDQAQEVVLTGVVREFQWTNPHTWIELDVTTADGAVQGWSLESGSTNALKRQGWSRSSVKAGDRVRVVINPLRSGEKGGALLGIVLADGTVRGKPVELK
jgi:Family of unknown function (DUF6152)